MTRNRPPLDDVTVRTRCPACLAGMVIRVSWRPGAPEVRAHRWPACGRDVALDLDGRPASPDQGQV